MPQRNQRKKSLEGSGKCKVNARDMLHWPNCGCIAFFSTPPPAPPPPPPPRRLMCRKYNTTLQNDVIGGIALWETKKEKYTPSFKEYQR